MAKSSEEKLREKLDKLRKDAAKKEYKQAEMFSKSVSKTEKELLGLFKLAEKLQQKLNSKDIKEVTKAADELEEVIEDISTIMNKTSKNIDKYSGILNDDFSKLSNSMEMSDKALAGLSNALSTANQKIKESEKVAEDTLKEWEKSAKDSMRAALGFSNSYNDYLTEGFNKTLASTHNIQQKLIKETKSFNNTRYGLIRGMNASEMKMLVEQLQDHNDSINKYFDDMGDDIDDALKETYTKVKAQNEELIRDVSAQLSEFEHTTGSFAKNLAQASDEIRDAITSLEVDQILQSFSDQVDGFIENRRQILARVGSEFEVDRLSDTISKAMSNAHYTLSRNEMSEVAQEFIKTTRIQSLDTVDDYLSDIAAMQKAYGTSVDNLSNIMWQDINSRADNQLFRGVSNIAASLENNANLYTSADAILEAINEKAGDMYGIARGDVKRQKELMKSVSTIQAIQQTAANKGVSSFSEVLSDLQNVGTDIELLQNEQFQQMRVISGMNSKDLIAAIRGGDIGSVYTSTFDNMQNWTEATYAQEYFNNLFGGSAGAKAFASQDRDSLTKLVEEVNKSIQEGEANGSLMASDKADKLTSVLDEIKNRFSDNFIVRGVSDFFGELDISLANAAHATIVATNMVKFFAKLPESLNLIKDAAFNFGSMLTKLPVVGDSILEVLTNPNGILAGIKTVGANMGNVLSTGISKLTGIVSKFGGPLLMAAGAIVAVKDAFGGWKKSKEWLGEEKGSTLSGKVSSALGGILGGTNAGIGEKGATFGGVAKNMGGGALKGGALGLAIGGPIGAGIGAILGAVAGAIGGKRIAKLAKGTWDLISDQGRNVFGLMGNVVSDQWKLMKETGGEIKKLWSDPKKGIFSKVGGTIKEVVTYPFKQLGTFLKTIKDWLVKSIKELPNRIFEPFIKLKKFITGIHDGITDFFGNLKDSVANFRKKLVEGIKNFPDKLKEAMDNFRKSIRENIHNLFSGTSGKSILKEVVGFLWEVSKTIYQVLWEVAKALLKSIPKIIIGIITAPFKLIWKGVTGFFDSVRNSVTNILDTLSFGLTKLFGKIGEVREDYNNYKENGGKFGVVGYGASKAAGWVKSKLGFANGLSEVPNDGLAYVHSGEAILTKAQAVMARADGGIDMSKVLAGGIGTLLGGPVGGALGLGIFEAVGLSKEVMGKLTKGLLGFFKSDEESTEEESKFQKALRKFFGIGITGGDEGTSGSSGIGGVFGNFIDKFKGLFGGESTSTGGTTSSGSGGGSSSHGGSSGTFGSNTGTGYSSSPQLATSGNYTDIRNQDLGSFSSMTLDEMNAWIESQAPEGSPFIGQGQIFLDASKESGLDPRYILAHAAVESGWGTSNIAKTKNNYFGIGAFDSSPYQSAYTFGSEDNSGLAAGIIEGSKWISDHYYNGSYGQQSLYSMRWNNGTHQYATDTGWDTKIASIMATAPTNTNAKSLSASSTATLSQEGSGDWVQNALAYLGFKEGSNNDTPFGSWIGSPNQPWCAAFVSWALAQAGISGLKSAAVSGLREQAQNLGIYHDKNDGYIPGYGDIFINKGGKASHTGFVLSSDGNSFQTIEGNAGDMVKQLTRKISDSAVSGFISLGNGGTYNGSPLAMSTEDANSLSTYATGTPWVPEDQLALVHQGEMIVPAEFNPLNNMEATGKFDTTNTQSSSTNKEVISAISMVVSELGKKLDTLISLQGRGPYKKTTANSDSAYLMYNT